jgi:methionine--tRNA ligase beta chain
MDTIPFDEFKKVHLVVAKIIDARKVEGSSKLYELQIRLGGETRTLVAGIAEKYSQEELFGKKIIVVENLEPKMLRGIESKGMLLAAESPDGTLSILTVDRDLPDGSEIH